MIVTEIFYALRSFLEKDSYQVFAAPFDIRFSESNDYDNPNTIVQPDISVFCNLNQLDEKGGKGAPSLIVEVLCPSTALKDRKQKYALYEKHGVKEYWIVDSIHQTIEVYSLIEKQYRNRAVFVKEDTLNSFVFPDFQLNLKSIL